MRSPTGSRLAGVAVLVGLGAGGCERTEYIHRPGFYSEASGRPLEEEWTKPDGTRVVVSNKPLGESDEPKRFQVMRVEILGETDEEREAREAKEAEEGIRELQTREELPDGKVILRAWTPEQVLAHLMTCLRNEEYDLLYEQLLDPAIRRNWESQGGGAEPWREFCLKNRRDLMATVNRMSFSLLGGDVVIEKLGANRLRTRFSPRLSAQFRFTTIDMDYTADGMKLVGIRE